jgi:hypothetical protein
MICIPTRGQYEQACNAAALEKMGVRCLKKIDENFPRILYQWVEEDTIIQRNYGHTSPQLTDRLMMVYEAMHGYVSNECPVWQTGKFA